MRYPSGSLISSRSQPASEQATASSVRRLSWLGLLLTTCASWRLIPGQAQALHLLPGGPCASPESAHPAEFGHHGASCRDGHLHVKYVGDHRPIHDMRRIRHEISDATKAPQCITQAIPSQSSFIHLRFREFQDPLAISHRRHPEVTCRCWVE
jgi:hypothetical protein